MQQSRKSKRKEEKNMTQTKSFRKQITIKKVWNQSME